MGTTVRVLLDAHPAEPTNKWNAEAHSQNYRHCAGRSIFYGSSSKAPVPEATGDVSGPLNVAPSDTALLTAQVDRHVPPS